MDKEQEIQALRQQLDTINTKIKNELSKIETVKENLRLTYRRADKEKYVKERDAIKENLQKYRAEQREIERKLAGLKAKV